MIGASALALAPLSCTLLVDWDTLHEDASRVGDAALDATRLDAAEAAAPSTDAGTYAAAVLAAKPVAYYRFEEPSGATVHSDVSGAPDGTIVGGAARGAGAVGGGIVLDGTDGRVDFGDAFAFVEDASKAFTIELWVRADRVDQRNDRIFSRELVNGTARSGVFAISRTDNVGFARQQMSGAGGMGVYSAGPLRASTFTHLAATCDGTTCRLYLDGVAVSGGTGAGQSLPPTTVSFLLGNANKGGNALQGAVDELAVYDTALPADVVAGHAHAR